MQVCAVAIGRPLDRLARNRINADLICEQWEDILRVAGSLSTGTVRASELLRVLQGGGRPSRLGRAIAELGRIAKTLHLLAWIDGGQEGVVLRLWVLVAGRARP